MKPIGPLNAVTAPVKTEPIKYEDVFNRCTFTPRVDAQSSPAARRFNFGDTAITNTTASSNVKVGSPPLDLAIKKTRTTVSKAPAKAKRITGKPRNATSRPSQIAITAPSELPLEIPSVNGVASEFRSKA